MYSHNDIMMFLLKMYYTSIQKEIQEEDLSIHCVWSYLRHISMEKVHKGYSKEVYIEANKCLYDLYKYSKEKGYIDFDYDTFLYTNWFYK